MVNTIIGPSAAGITCFFFSKYFNSCESRYDFSSLTNGILGGLVAVTAGCNGFEPWAGFVVGIIGAFVYLLSCKLMDKIKVDDPIQATQVHGFCGAWGVLAVAFFHKDKGIFYGAEGAGKLLGAQFMGIAAIFAWTASLTTIFFLIAKKMGIARLSPEEEILGGDIHYFGPIDFAGELHNYDVEAGV